MRRLWIGALAFAVSSASAFSAQSPPVASFTVQQADKGRIAFYEHCAVCHGADLQGVNAPALSGNARSNVGSQTALAVESYIDNAMPIGNVGILRSAELLEITAFLMQQNGRRPGKTPLTLATIKTDTTALSSGKPGQKVSGGH